MLGSPSTKATFGKQDIWYYIGKKTETLAFFEPKLLERKILVIKFDDQGVVETVTSYDASAGKRVELVERVTPTKGKELGFLECLVRKVPFDQVAKASGIDQMVPRREKAQETANQRDGKDVPSADPPPYPG